MSARDAESGSSTYKGGSGRAGGLGNGGVGGGMGGGGNYGGGMGGGAARNGGIGSRTGLTTGNRMIGGIAVGRPGGLAQNPGAWGRRSMPGISQGLLNRPAVPGLLGPTPVPAAVPGVTPIPENAPWTPEVDVNWWGQTLGPQRYNPSLSPGYEAYTSVYKVGPASPNYLSNQDVRKNQPGGTGPYTGNAWNRPSGATGWGR